MDRPTAGQPDPRAPQQAAQSHADHPGRFGFADPQGGGGAAASTAELRRRRTVIMGIIAGLIVLVLIAVLVITVVQRRGSADSGAQAEAVQGYLSAVADGDSQRALGYLAQRPGNTDLMTDKVLEASHKLAPITGISVSDPAKGANTVRAWYKIGDRRYQQQFSLEGNGKSYLIDGGTATADLRDLPKGLSYKLNGVAFQDKDVTLFPGSYRISANSTLFDLGKQADFVARSQDQLTVALTPRLTSAGKKSAQAAINKAIKDCLASTTLKAGCGLTLTGNGPGKFKVKDGSIKRSLSKEAAGQLKHLQLISDDTDPTLIRTTGISGNIRTVATCERDKGKRKRKKTKECTLRGAGTSLDSPQVRVAGDRLTVDWY